MVAPSHNLLHVHVTLLGKMNKKRKKSEQRQQNNFAELYPGVEFRKM